MTALLTLGLMLFLTHCEKCEKDITIKDIDGNVYRTTTVGDQTWMAENLRTTRYSDGTSIPYVDSRNAWAVFSSSSKAYCYYGDDQSNSETYGALYTWAAAMNGTPSSISNPSRVQGACPTGWHLPSDAEWNELAEYLGGIGVAGGKLKETGTIHWMSPNSGATNESGFSALPGGAIFAGFGSSGSNNIGALGAWWSSTAYNLNSLAIIRYLINELSSLNSSNNPEIYGLSIRCVEDNGDITLGLPTVNTDIINNLTDITALFTGTVSEDGGSTIKACGFLFGADSTILNSGTGTLTFDELFNGTFTHTTTNLKPGIKYYVKAYATNNTGTGYGKTMSFTTKVLVNNITFNPSVEYGNLVDQDGNSYNTVEIGNQTWMAENLKAITYTDGTPIKNIYNQPYVFWYNDDPTSFKANYGALYSAHAIYENSAKLCPVGWHVPSSAEWDTLLIYLGGISVAGGKIKETGTAHWNDPNNGATNESGFTAMPGGYYKNFKMGSDGYYFSSTMRMTRQAGVDILTFNYSHLNYNSEYCYNSFADMGSPGYASVRCVKD